MTMPRYYEGYDKNDNSTGAVLLTFILGAADRSSWVCYLLRNPDK